MRRLSIVLLRSKEWCQRLTRWTDIASWLFKIVLSCIGYVLSFALVIPKAGKLFIFIMRSSYWIESWHLGKFAIWRCLVVLGWNICNVLKEISKTTASWVLMLGLFLLKKYYLMILFSNFFFVTTFLSAFGGIFVVFTFLRGCSVSLVNFK